jgi:GxxExxY protein
VELKAVIIIEPVYKAQVLLYLRLSNKKLALLINFNVPLLRQGISRIIL